MGGGRYSTVSRSVRATTDGFYTKSRQEIFKQRNVNNAMDPNGIDIRESRDSEEHPQSVAIILALDVTGSMGSIPHYLIKDGLPHIMDGIIQTGIKDPQMLFLGIGDHECDDSPLQVGQFESSDELLDHWLTKVWLEGGGGGNGGESYHLAWYFAAKHTSIDCLENRKQKGFLFTIGDEPVLKQISKRSLTDIMGPESEPMDYSSIELLDKAREMYNVYHLHLRQGSNGRREEVINGWRELMGDNLIIIERKEEVSNVVAEIVSSNIDTKFISEVDVSNLNMTMDDLKESIKDTNVSIAEDVEIIDGKDEEEIIL